MYKYSKQAQKRFFENPALAFLFAWFANASGEGHEFVEAKYKDKGLEYLERIYSEIATLRKQALEALNEHAQQIPPQQQMNTMSPMLNRYIEVVTVTVGK